jgi:hypothetical protein
MYMSHMMPALRFPGLLPQLESTKLCAFRAFRLMSTCVAVMMAGADDSAMCHRVLLAPVIELATRVVLTLAMRIW